MLAAVMLAALAAVPGPAETPTEMLKARDAEIRAAVPEGQREITPPIRAKLEKIVTRTIDLKGMAEAALGPRWKEMTAQQRKRLLAAFEKRFRATGGSGLGSEWRSANIEYRPEQPQSDGVVKVPTTVVLKGEPTEIDYTVRREKEGWRIVDITIDGVSTVENYRASFARVIAKEGVEGLIRRLDSAAAARGS